MGQSSLILVFAVLLGGGVLLYNAQRTNQDSSDQTTRYQNDMLGREAAAVGLEQAVRKLVADPDNWSDPNRQDRYGASSTSYGTASYSVAITGYRPGPNPLSDTILVEATGVAGGRSYLIEAAYTKGVTNIGVPPGFRYPLFSDKELRMNGSVTVKNTDATANANIHTNNELRAVGSPQNFIVEGYGTFTESGSVGNVNFQPNDDVNGSDPDYFQDDSVRVPPLDPTPYASSPPSTVVETGDVTLSGTQIVNLETDGWRGVTGSGTADDPYLWYIDGNLTIDGDIRLVGYSQIVVTGNVVIQGNGSLTSTAAAPPDQQDTDADIRTWTETNLPDGNTMSISAAGGIELGGNISVVATLFANGEVSYKGGGHRTIVGSIASMSPMEMKGNTSVWYNGASDKIILPGFDYDVPTGIRIVDYAEWPDRAP